MNEWRFRIMPGLIPVPLLEKAYFAGWGRVPHPTQVAIEDGELIIGAASRESGTIHVPMQHQLLGITMESTETLLSRETPYLLLKELGRGAFGRLNRRLFDWQMLGFRCPITLKTRVADQAHRFSQAIISDDDIQTQQTFLAVLEELSQIVLEATQEFTNQSAAWRMRNNEKLSVSLGIGIGSDSIESLYEFDLYAKFLQESFHAVLPMPTWRELEPEPGIFDWDRLEQRVSMPSRFGFRVVMGPMLSFDESAFPDWVLPQLEDDDFFETRVTRFVNSIAERYGNSAQCWILANHVNTQSLKYISQSRVIALIRILAQQMRSRGISKPIMVGIDQPWGEYLIRQTPEWEQLQIAESLMGCREIDAFLLEMNFGFDDRSTLPRDPMSISNMIDQWSFLGKKVFISLSVPSGTDSPETDPVYHWSEQQQQVWTEMLLKTILGKRMVHGILWTPLQDPAEPGPQHYRGLIDSQHVLKSAFKHFTHIRQTMLK
jgi:hypothetical protein